MKNVISIREKLINLNISYKLNPELRNLSTDFTLNICLFGSAKLTKMMIQINKRIAPTALDLILVKNFYLQMEALEIMLLFFGGGMSSSVYVDSKNKDILILGEGPTQGR